MPCESFLLPGDDVLELFCPVFDDPGPAGVFVDLEPVTDVGILGDHAAAFEHEEFDVMTEAADDDADAPHGDDGEGDLVEDLDEGPHLEEIFFVESVEVFEFLFRDGVGGGFAVCCLSVDEEMGTGGEEVGAADKAEVFCDAVEGVSFLVGYSEICMLSHFYFVG